MECAFIVCVISIKKKGDNMSTDVTLNTAVSAYIAHLKETGAAGNTVKIYENALRRAVSYFGENKLLSKILIPHVAALFNSDFIVKSPSGNPLALITIAQNKRVFRQCMQYAVEQGWIKSIPISKDEMPERGRVKK